MASDGQIVNVGGRRLRVTNLDKVVYPETATTKGEVIGYVTQIAPLLLPVIAGRPVTRKRWVEGVGTDAAPEASFFTKQLERGAPSWIARMPIEHSDGPKEYPLLDEVAALAWTAQVAALELHVPQWRFRPDGTRGRPDRMVLDLDPGPGVPLAQCAAIARLVRAILDDMGLATVPVTSGSKGIHLYAPLPVDDDGFGLRTSEEVSMIAKELARSLEADHPDAVTSVMAKVARPGRVFIDWSQNNAAKTTIAPYSLRGRSHPWVAAPRTWDELDDPDLAQLTFDEVLARAASGLDPFGALHADASPEAFSIPPAPSSAPSPATRAASAARPAVTGTRPAPRTESASDNPAAGAIIPPMLAVPATPTRARSRTGETWAEIKWDGIRALGFWRNGRFTLQARSGIDITTRYPELTADGRPFLPVGEAIVDGEIIALDATGRPSFSRLQNRMHLTSPREIEREVIRTPVSYQLFDLLSLEGNDITGLPLRDRRELLEKVAAELDAPIAVPPVFDDLDTALQTSTTLDLEGIVVKDAASRYRPGERSDSWMKIMHLRTQEVVIGGIRPGKGDRAGRIGSLLLGVPDPTGLRYVGRVGTGFTDRMLRDLDRMLTPLRTTTVPFVDVPAADASDALWVQPQLVAEVEFANWTPDGSLRHPRWRGLRPDKAPDEITRTP